MNTLIGNIQIIESNIYNPNKLCNAIPFDNYEFVQYNGDEFINRLLLHIKTNQFISLNIKDSTPINDSVHSISAEFTPKTQYTIDILSTYLNAGIITGYGTSYNNTFTLNVTPYDEYNFIEWAGDIVPLTDKHKLTITLTLSKSDPYLAISAVFLNRNEYTIFEYVDGTIIRNKLDEITDTTIQRINYKVINNNIKKIIIGTSVTKIHNYAFANCAKLESVSFADPTCNIIFGLHVFENCISLTQFDFLIFNNKDIPNYTFCNTGFSTIEFNDIIINKIEHHAFYKCKKLTKLLNNTINSGCIKILDSYVFSECTKLQYIAFTKILNNLGEYSFSNTNIINIDTSNTTFNIIPAYCFYLCNNLTTIKLSTNINTLCDNCFGKCDKLNSIDLKMFNDNIPNIITNTTPFPECVSGSPRKFYFKSNKESLLAYSHDGWKQYNTLFDPYISSNTILIFNIPSPNTKITFIIYSNNKLVVIDFGDSNKTTIDSCPINGKLIKHKYVNNGRYLVTINDTITSIKCNDKTLTSILNLSHNITSISKLDFANCRDLTSVFIPINITSIDTGAFGTCNKLSISNITVLNGFTINNSWIVLNNGILVDIFKLLSNNITTFDARGTNLKILTKKCFESCDKLTNIYLPNTILEIQQPILSPLAKIKVLTIETGNKYIIDNGFLLSNDGKHIIMSTSNPSTIPSTVTELLEYSFSNTDILFITIPSTVTKIHNKAFYNNTELTSISIQLTKHLFDYQYTDYCPWFYSGINYLTMPNKDNKIQARRLNIHHSDDTTTTHILLTNLYGYIEKPINKSKVKLTTISLDYSGSSNPLRGMTKDSDRFKSLLSDFVLDTNVTVFKNSAATKSNIENHLLNIVDTSLDDELFIFHFSGHGGYTKSNKSSYMCLFDRDLYDYEFWNYIQHIKGRVMTLFCCCHAGTMFKSINLNNNDVNYNIINNEMANWNESAYNFFKLKKQLLLYTTDTILDDTIDDTTDDDIISDIYSDITYIDDEENLPSIIVYSACKDDEVSYMDENVGHALMTSIINNFTRSNKLDSYYSLYLNSTTPNEDSTISRIEDGKLYEITPLMTIIGDFNANIRAFT